MQRRLSTRTSPTNKIARVQSTIINPLIFIIIVYFEKCFQEYHQTVSNSLDTDQAVGPDLGPNLFEKFIIQAGDTST